MTHAFKKIFIDEESNYKVGYYVDGIFQKYVSKDKPMYIEWLKTNAPDNVPFIPPEPVPIEELRKLVVDKILWKRTDSLNDGMIFNGMQIDTRQESRDLILGGTRKAKKDSQYKVKGILKDGALHEFTNQELKDIEDTLDDFGSNIQDICTFEYEKSLTATREQLEYYMEHEEFE